MAHSKRPKNPITDPLLKGIKKSKRSIKSLSEETGVDRASIGRFVHGERSLRLDVADKLAKALEMELKDR